MYDNLMNISIKNEQNVLRKVLNNFLFQFFFKGAWAVFLFGAIGQLHIILSLCVHILMVLPIEMIELAIRLIMIMNALLHNTC